VAAVLLLSAGLALWLTTVVRRRHAPGRRSFVKLLLAIALWSLGSAAHAVTDSLAAKIVWSQVQYIGIATVPPLWLMFAFEYGGSTWTQRRRNLALLWVVPALTMAVAFTNDWHHALWPTVTLTADGAAIYAHGWWFWVATGVNYVFMILGSLGLVRALRRSPAAYRGQFIMMLGAAVLPWAGNLVYILDAVPVPGLDPTPPMFTLSAVLLTHALYRRRLFDLVPVARHRLIEHLSDAVVVIDPARRVLDMNAAAIRLAAGDRTFLPAWLGRPVESLMPFLRDTALVNGCPADASFVVSIAESHYEVRVTEVRGGDDPRLLGWAVLLRDVTELRRAAAERELLEKRVQEQQKRESLSVLAGGLAHDFNNLLAGIIGNADLLSLKLAPSSDAGSHVGAILLGAQRAADLVSKMLAYAGERHGASEHIDLDALIREMLDLLQASVARHCTLGYQGEPVRIFADPVQIRQVAMNLIINAAEAVEEETGVVEVSVGLQRLSSWQLARMQFGDAAAAGEYAFLEVRDNGSGMDDATLRRIFTPFYSTKPSGHGLGLSAVE
jgi:signal transduction histidine kinase